VLADLAKSCLGGVLRCSSCWLSWQSATAVVVGFGYRGDSLNIGRTFWLPQGWDAGLSKVGYEGDATRHVDVDLEPRSVPYGETVSATPQVSGVSWRFHDLRRSSVALPNNVTLDRYGYLFPELDEAIATSFASRPADARADRHSTVVHASFGVKPAEGDTTSATWSTIVQLALKPSPLR
jgi:hypothetical protein